MRSLYSVCSCKSNTKCLQPMFSYHTISLWWQAKPLNFSAILCFHSEFFFLTTCVSTQTITNDHKRRQQNITRDKVLKLVAASSRCFRNISLPSAFTILQRSESQFGSCWSIFTSWATLASHSSQYFPREWKPTKKVLLLCVRQIIVFSNVKHNATTIERNTQLINRVIFSIMQSSLALPITYYIARWSRVPSMCIHLKDQYCK